MHVLLICRSIFSDVFQGSVRIDDWKSRIPSPQELLDYHKDRNIQLFSFQPKQKISIEKTNLNNVGVLTIEFNVPVDSCVVVDTIHNKKYISISTEIRGVVQRPTWQTVQKQALQSVYVISACSSGFGYPP